MDQRRSRLSWYKNSTACYAYLADVHRSPDRKDCVGPNEWPQWKPSLGQSRWFQRGWTLQELIAPKNVFFCDSEWHCFASKSSIPNHIAEITGIDSYALIWVQLSSLRCCERDVMGI
jgi:hypothetical protein